MANIFLTLLLIYLAVIALYYFAQTGMLFFPRPVTGTLPPDESVEEVTISTAGGNLLHGWLCKVPDEHPQKLIIYFGGNAEEVSHMIHLAPNFDGWAFLLVNYPGYGASSGKPGERSFYDAALAVWDFAASRDDVDAGSIVLFGRSIGTASAVYLAGNRNPRAVVLVSPFESIRSVAQSKLPFLPVGLMLRHKFELETYASQIDAPLLAFYGSDDNIIRPRHSKNLVNRWKGEARLIEVTGYGHNDIFGSSLLWSEIGRFLDGL